MSHADYLQKQRARRWRRRKRRSRLTPDNHIPGVRRQRCTTKNMARQQPQRQTCNQGKQHDAPAIPKDSWFKDQDNGDV
jgi:hypothetical protein